MFLLPYGWNFYLFPLKYVLKCCPLLYLTVNNTETELFIFVLKTDHLQKRDVFIIA